MHQTGFTFARLAGEGIGLIVQLHEAKMTEIFWLCLNVNFKDNDDAIFLDISYVLPEKIYLILIYNKFIYYVITNLHRHSICRHSRSGMMRPLPGPRPGTDPPQYLVCLVYPPGPSSSRGKWSLFCPRTGTRILHNVFTIMPLPTPTVQIVLFAISDVPFDNFAWVLRKRKSFTHLRI